MKLIKKVIDILIYTVIWPLRSLWPEIGDWQFRRTWKPICDEWFDYMCKNLNMTSYLQKDDSYLYTPIDDKGNEPNGTQ